MKAILTTILVAIMLSACSSGNSKVGAATSDRKFSTLSVANDEKHRLYSAALAASESPLDTDLFKDVCKKIEIFDPVLPMITI